MKWYKWFFCWHKWVQETKEFSHGWETRTFCTKCEMLRPGGSSIRLNIQPFTLAPGESKTLEIKFYPRFKDLSSEDLPENPFQTEDK